MKIKRGDFLFFESVERFPDNLWDFFIKIASPKATHCGVAVSETHMIHADLRGVHVAPIPKQKINVKRLNEEIDYEIIIRYMTEQKGEPYTVFGAVVAGVLSLFNLRRVVLLNQSIWFCSKVMGAPLVIYNMADEFRNVSPSDILPQDLLTAKIYKKEFTIYA